MFRVWISSRHWNSRGPASSYQSGFFTQLGQVKHWCCLLISLMTPNRRKSQKLRKNPCFMCFRLIFQSSGLKGFILATNWVVMCSFLLYINTGSICGSSCTIKSVIQAKCKLVLNYNENLELSEISWWVILPASNFQPMPAKFELFG